MSTAPLSFSAITLSGIDAEKFLQGQVTVDVTKLTPDTYQPAAICDLKGRIAFGLWLKRISPDTFDVVTADDLLPTLQAHLKKYGAFSKMTISAATAAYPHVADGIASFQTSPEGARDTHLWQQTAIASGAAWITAATAGLFQPQELRLHQRGGVHYDKGCYLGQEIVARLYFRAQPKAWLHRIGGTGDVPAVGSDIATNVHVVNVIATPDCWQALVVAKPDALSSDGITVLPLPDALNGPVGREG